MTDKSRSPHELVRILMESPDWQVELTVWDGRYGATTILSHEGNTYLLSHTFSEISSFGPVVDLCGESESDEGPTIAEILKKVRAVEPAGFYKMLQDRDKLARKSVGVDPAPANLVESAQSAG